MNSRGDSILDHGCFKRISMSAGPAESFLKSFSDLNNFAYAPESDAPSSAPSSASVSNATKAGMEDEPDAADGDDPDAGDGRATASEEDSFASDDCAHLVASAAGFSFSEAAFFATVFVVPPAAGSPGACDFASFGPATILFGFGGSRPENMARCSLATWIASPSGRERRRLWCCTRLSLSRALSQFSPCFPACCAIGSVFFTGMRIRLLMFKQDLEVFAG